MNFIAAAVWVIGFGLLWEFAHAALKAFAPLEGNYDEKLPSRIGDVESKVVGFRIELERLRDEQAKVHALADDAKRLMSQANLGLGFKTRAKMD